MSFYNFFLKQLPDNFRVLLYPEDKMFHRYPTIAPNGKVILDNIIGKVFGYFSGE